MKIIGSSPKYIEYWKSDLNVNTKSQKLVFDKPSIKDYLLIAIMCMFLVVGMYLTGSFLMYVILGSVCVLLIKFTMPDENKLSYSKNNIKHIDIKLEDGFMKNLIKFKDGEWVQTQSELGILGKMEYKVLSEWGNIKSTKQL